MKKILTLFAAVLLGFNANAQSVELLNLPTTAADAEAAGYGQMWNTWDWGALVPAGTVLYNGENVKLTLESDAFLGYPGSKAGKNDYGFALCMSSTLSNFVSEPVLDPTSVAVTSSGKQGGVVTLEPAVDGKVTLYYSSGFNNRSMFVFDVTESFNEGIGGVILANNIEQGADKGDQMKADGVTDKVHTPTFDVVAGHKYYIVGSGSQQELYQIAWTSFMTDNYKVTTGISTITTAEQNVGNGAMYNLAGQRISAPVSGQIYIMNGKKYIKK